MIDAEAMEQHRLRHVDLHRALDELVADVERLTVVEIDPDVIALVAPHYTARWGTRLEIIQGDAFTWSIPKGARWDVAWHDVWPTLSGDNLPQVCKLHRRFGRRCDWQGSWGRELLVAERRRYRRHWWSR